jgi:hypothetical protein
MNRNESIVVRREIATNPIVDSLKGMSLPPLGFTGFVNEAPS